MRRFLFTSLFAATAAIGCSPMAYAQRACVPVAAAQVQSEMATQQAGGTAIALSGDQAERFLDYINDNIGQHTEYWGDGVLVTRFPALGYDARQSSMTVVSTKARLSASIPQIPPQRFSTQTKTRIDNDKG